MRSFSKFLTLCIVAMLLPFNVMASPVVIDSAPRHVKVGIYLWKIGALDLPSNTYPIDFYLTFKCTPTCGTLAPDFLNDISFINGTAPLLSKQIDKPDYKVYRVQATFYDPFNLYAYPFDSHKLPIIIEDKYLNASELIFEVDPVSTGIYSGVYINGFKINPQWHAEVSIFQHAGLGSISRYVFSVDISRYLLIGILKSVVPALIILITGFISLLIRPERVMERLTTTTAALVAMVLYHVEITSSIPPAGYLTYADMMMIICYFCLLLTIISTLIMMRMLEHHQRERVHKINIVFVTATPVLWLILQIICWYYFFN